MKKNTLFTLALIFLVSLLSPNLMAQLSLESFQNVNLENAESINSERLDFSPTYYQNGVVFISSREAYGSRDKKIDETFFKMYYAAFDVYGNPQNVQVFSLELDSPLHEGPVSFNDKGDVMYFTRNNQVKGYSKADENGVVKLQIYKAEKTEFGWVEVEGLSFNSDSYSVVHPSLSRDGQYLFFASDMPGGFGGMDIYFTKKISKDEWSTPVNLGKEINSKGQDIFPYIHTSGKLFFSSSRKGGLGGLDLYMADGNHIESLEKAYHLGNSINSPQDDLGLILNDAGTEGFLTSSREGGKGKDDLYSINFENISFATSGISTKIKVFDYSTNEIMPDVHLRVFEKITTRTYKGSQFYNAILVPGSSNANELAVKVLSTKDRNVIIPDMVSNMHGEIIFNHKSNKEYILEFYRDGYQTEEITYYKANAIGKANLMVQMVKANQYADIRNILRNNQTGLPIANAIVRIEGCDDVQEQVTDIYGAYTYKMKQKGCDYKISVVKQGFYSGTAVVHNADEAESLQMGIDAVTISKQHVNNTTATLQTGSVVVLNNIYYDYGKSAVRVGHSPELDLVAKMMIDYPEMHIELISHTDSRGSSAYNQLLSLKRSESAARYLVGQGISKNRMVAVGYGEEVPRNNCIDGVDCTEQAYKFNRRTEIKVTKMLIPVAIQYNSDLFYNK